MLIPGNIFLVVVSQKKFNVMRNYTEPPYLVGGNGICPLPAFAPTDGV